MLLKRVKLTKGNDEVVCEAYLKQEFKKASFLILQKKKIGGKDKEDFDVATNPIEMQSKVEDIVNGLIAEGYKVITDEDFKEAMEKAGIFSAEEFMKDPPQELKKLTTFVAAESYKSLHAAGFDVGDGAVGIASFKRGEGEKAVTEFTLRVKFLRKDKDSVELPNTKRRF